MKRCNWVNLANERYVRYHDEEWGRAEHDDQKLFELFILEGFQAGLSWECVLNKRDNFRKAYRGFDPQVVANFTDEDVKRLREDKSIIRNRLKITGSIVNARLFLELQKEWGSFDRYIWHFTDGHILHEPYTLRTTSPLSDTISKDLKKRGFKFVGSTIIYSFLQAIGIINAHGPECELSSYEKL
ncbi:MAG: DNA-3-methyladenine glycosylase I [Prevotella sp.]|jgi:DNA-3-methyladenine glycosylase I